MPPENPHLTLPVGARDHVQGSQDARVTLVEYGDYECSHCGRAYPIVKGVQRRLGNKLRFVFRNYPLVELHPHAEAAAEISEAATAEGKFWEMHDVLFENQGDLEVDHLLGYGAALGLNMRRVTSELERRVHLPRVREDIASGIRSGVNGTPTFFINGVRFDGSWDEQGLTAAISDVFTKDTMRG